MKIEGEKRKKKKVPRPTQAGSMCGFRVNGASRYLQSSEWYFVMSSKVALCGRCERRLMVGARGEACRVAVRRT